MGFSIACDYSGESVVIRKAEPFRIVVLLCPLFSTALLFTSCSSVGANDLSRIQHVVFLIKENRTFDNYFGTFPGADGATTGIISNGNSIPLRPISDSTPAGNLCNS